MKSKKKELVLILVLIVSLFSFIYIIDSASAAKDDSDECIKSFPKGNIYFCGIPTKYCSHTTCNYCVKGYNAADNCYYYAGFDCKKYCVGSGSGSGGGSNDLDAPVITINSPQNNQLYSTRKVTLGIALNEQAKIEYTDLNDGRGRWSTFCKSCSSGMKSLSFNDGENRYLIKATDGSGNEETKEIKFFIDSQKPRIHTFGPLKGYADGTFWVQYTEDNLQEVTINYGNVAKGFNSTKITSCDNGKKQNCEIEVNLKKYDGQQIEYYFTIKDIAGSVVESKKAKLDVDVSFPNITSLNYRVEDRKVYFDIDVNEANLASITYTDESQVVPKPKKLCSKLVDEKCNARVTFGYGEHYLNIEVSDKAGNIISWPVNVTI
ncbi:MAG TPA: hypothetical protein P5277_02215 [Candidatus Paceibacterota bacterium]|nr:hypothetical protein [Candidatus Paceibacterota bacterium]